MDTGGTFILALVGALTGAAALAWSILEFAFGGAWVTVRIVAGWMGPGRAVPPRRIPFGASHLIPRSTPQWWA